MPHDEPTFAALDAPLFRACSLCKAMTLAVTKAKEHGVAAVSAANSHHLGRPTTARLAADAGLIGSVTSTAPTPAVMPTNGSKPLLGTNPLSFAAPARTETPLPWMRPSSIRKRLKQHPGTSARVAVQR